MSEVQRLLIEENGETYEIFVEAKSDPVVAAPTASNKRPGEMGFADDALVKMQQARSTIRGYTLYALSAFRDLGLAEVQEVTLKFGLKIGGKVGIPYITEGTTDCNLEISVKCTVPKKTQQA
ncbi:MAG TPA: CU044_2847 family protein [Thermosynechococcaceae cyanobacterium]